MKLTKNLRKMILAGAALAVCTGFALNAQAQDCTVDNWDVQQGLADSDTGTQGANNRRYGGPCGLRHGPDRNESYDCAASPNGETSYIARFYTFLDDVNTSDPVMIFAAGDDNDNSLLEVSYEDGDLTLAVYGATTETATFSNIGSGWHSVEVVWAAGEDTLFKVDEEGDLAVSADTSGQTIHYADLGNLNEASGGSIDFDDFDSRRSERPGRLCVGDTNGDEQLSMSDVNNIYKEVQSFGSWFADGQPDFNEDGNITMSDRNAVFERVQGFNFDCP